jgi:AraC family transcriptional regulator
MEPRIEYIPPKLLIGRRLSMSLAENRTNELWKGFMPRKKEISSKKNSDLISMQIYDESHNHGNLNSVFEKWAAVEVLNFVTIPDEMEKYTLQGGLYAVFHYHGDSRSGAETFSYIFKTWLPASPYRLDNREHFEILGEKYKNNDPDSEEEIWIPIKLKA